VVRTGSSGYQDPPPPPQPEQPSRSRRSWIPRPALSPNTSDSPTWATFDHDTDDGGND
jgi:hypothetical protein